MSEFKKNLESLPSIDKIQHLELLENGNAEPIALIENKPGKAGSVAVYHALMLAHGQLNYESAKEGLEIFAEHVISAAQNPGLHPNIDLLFNVIENDRVISIRVVNR